VEGRTEGATLYGATPLEKATVVLGKLSHYGLLLAMPAYFHGWGAALTGAAAYTVAQSVVLATTFAVSHNLQENKPEFDGSPTTATLTTPSTARDWGLHQIQTSSNWGGAIGCFFTGGLNLQIEHHLFPAISFGHYPAISAIVRDECAKRGVEYVHYDTLPDILARFSDYMRDVGAMETMPEDPSILTPGLLARL